MKKRTHWWIIVHRKADRLRENKLFKTRRAAYETLERVTFATLWKVIKVVAASTVTANTKQPWVDVVLRTVR